MSIKQWIGISILLVSCYFHSKFNYFVCIWNPLMIYGIMWQIMYSSNLHLNWIIICVLGNEISVDITKSLIVTPHSFMKQKCNVKKAWYVVFNNSMKMLVNICKILAGTLQFSMTGICRSYYVHRMKLRHSVTFPDLSVNVSSTEWRNFIPYSPAFVYSEEI